MHQSPIDGVVGLPATLEKHKYCLIVCQNLQSNLNLPGRKLRGRPHRAPGFQKHSPLHNYAEIIAIVDTLWRLECGSSTYNLERQRDSRPLKHKRSLRKQFLLSPPFLHFSTRRTTQSPRPNITVPIPPNLQCSRCSSSLHHLISPPLSKRRRWNQLKHWYKQWVSQYLSQRRTK